MNAAKLPEQDAQMLALEEEFAAVVSQYSPDDRPGAVIRVVEGERSAYLSTGTPPKDYGIGCAIQDLQALICAELAENGALDLNAHICNYIPELSGSIVGNRVTPAHLLSHTAGYQGLRYFSTSSDTNTWSELKEFLCDTEQLFTPGEVFDYQYSNGALLREIVTRVQEQSVMRMIGDRIFDPLGVYPKAPPDSTIPPIWDTTVSSLRITDVDALRIACSLAGVGSGRKMEISESAIALCQSEVIVLPPCIDQPPIEMRPSSFGLGTAGYGNGYVGTSGAGMDDCFSVRFCPSERLVIVVGIRTRDHALRGHVVTWIHDHMESARPARDTSSIYYKDIELVDFVGEYRGTGERTLKCILEGDALRIWVRGRGGRVFGSFSIARHSGELRLSPTPSYWACSLYFDRSTGAPVVGLGKNAFGCVA